MKNSICEVSINDLSCVELYRVPLVCEAAPQIGCGCRTKPVLIALEHHATVKRVWLRRSGTAVAVQWHQQLPEEDAMRIVNAAFTDEGTVELLNGVSAMNSSQSCAAAPGGTVPRQSTT